MLYSQKDNDPVFKYALYDSAYSIIPLKLIGFNQHIYQFDSLTFFDNSDSIKSFLERVNGNPYQKSLSEPDYSAIDFSKNAVILYVYRGGDCHSKFDIKMFDDTDTREYKLVVKVIYGGCRAGGHTYLNWAMIPKPPPDYKVTYHTYMYDDYHNKYK